MLGGGAFMTSGGGDAIEKPLGRRDLDGETNRKSTSVGLLTSVLGEEPRSFWALSGVLLKQVDCWTPADYIERISFTPNTRFWGKVNIKERDLEGTMALQLASSFSINWNTAETHRV